jgi:hypothetical protein
MVRGNRVRSVIVRKKKYDVGTRLSRRSLICRRRRKSEHRQRDNRDTERAENQFRPHFEVHLLSKIRQIHQVVLAIIADRDPAIEIPGMAISRREMLVRAAGIAAAWAFPLPLLAGDSSDAPTAEDATRLRAWAVALRSVGMNRHSMPLGPRAIKVGELAIGTPYVPNTLEAYIKAGGDPTRDEPVTLWLTKFDCVTLVESCLAVARASDERTPPTWARFSHEVERMRYRGGKREGYSSRLHYFSEWISDGEKRGLVHNLGEELGGIVDPRPLRFMTEHRSSYPALADDSVYGEIGEMERRLDSNKRWVIPTDKIESVSDKIQTGDVLAFATAIPGIDVTHAAFAYRGNDGILRVLHAPLSGGAVEITRTTLPEYVARIRRSTGILIARPLSA